MSKQNKATTKRLLELLGGDDGFVPETPLDAVLTVGEKESERFEPMRFDIPCAKFYYVSESSAKRAMRRRLNKGANVSSLRVYKCDLCSGWHFSSSFRKF